MICVGGLLVRDGHLLLCLRSAVREHYPSVWDVPGGHALPGEHPEEALVRELREEIGVMPTQMTLLDVARYTGREEAYEYRIYLVARWEGTPDNLQPEEHTEIRWFSPTQVECAQLAHPAYLDLFRRALRLIESDRWRKPRARRRPRK